MTYSNINNATKKAPGETITLSNLISKRFYHSKKGNTDLNIKDIEIDKLVALIGGRGVNYERLIKNAINLEINFGIYARIAYSGNRWHYIAGQDYTSEMNLVRKLLREGK